MTIPPIDRLIEFPESIDRFFADSSQAKTEYAQAGHERNLRNAQVFLFIVVVSQIVVGLGRFLGEYGLPYYNVFIIMACLTLSGLLRSPRVGAQTTSLSIVLFSAWAATFPFFIIRLGGYSAPTYPVYIIIILYILVFFHYSFSQYLFLFLIIYLSNIGIFFLQPDIAIEEFVYRQIVMAIVVGVGIVGSYINVRNRQREFFSQYSLRAQKEELENAYNRLAKAEMQIVQSEKLTSLGKMAAGMAHEINNPLGFVAGNLDSLEGYVSDLKRLWTEIDGLELNDAARNRVESLRKDVHFDDLCQDVQQCLESSRRGTSRIGKILEKLRHFSRLDEAAYKPLLVEDCLESALSIVDTDGIEIRKDYGSTPQIHGMPALLNQVFHSLIENAVDAIRSNTGEKGQIRLATTLEESGGSSNITITVNDNGCGMDEATLARVFDPFFTTKKVGQGQGLGLALAHGIITEHGGTISCTSSPGESTTFRIRLPVST